MYCLSHVLRLLPYLFLACYWNEASCSPGEGKTVWHQTDSSDLDQYFLHGAFPTGFLWGSGTSAFQTEGSSDELRDGASIWDHFTKTPVNGSDSYTYWEKDVEALEFLGANAYTFSLSWSRLFPYGDSKDPPNVEAVEHYKHLIDRLLERNIEPIVTLHHWDLPQVLQEKYGGWRNETMVQLFADYASFCFHSFGSRVKYWLTMHNPYLVATQGYGTGAHAPGETGSALIAAHHMIKAHASAWHIYDTKFRSVQKGHVSIVLGSHWVEPQKGRTNDANVDLCQRSMEAVLGWFASPIFQDGDYPDSLKATHGRLLPEFSTEEKLFARKTADFFALSFGPNNFRLGKNIVNYEQSVTPDLRRVLAWIKMEYEDPKVLIAEGGWFTDASAKTEDTVAIYLMKKFINQVLQAVTLERVNVFGYTQWSLVDGLEWNYGFSARRGLFFVDFNQANKTRTPKTSAQYYRSVILDNGFPQPEHLTEVKGCFPCGFHWGIADSTLKVHFFPFSPQFTDPHVYSWNLTGDGSLRPVPGVKLSTHRAQCTDYLAIRSHLRLFASTGASHYRFALNWSLILPNGDLSSVNREALRYYRCVLTELKKLGLEAVVILYYPSNRAPNLGLPGRLHASGGWLNSSTVEAFTAYAALCYWELGSWVRYWITVNEPNRLLDLYSSEREKHLVAHNLLLAHAKAWRLHEKEHYYHQGTMVSLALHADWAEPANPFLESHKTATQRFLLFELGRFLDPLLGARCEQAQSRGDYPKEVKEYMETRAKKLGLPESYLPSFTDTEREELRGALSFIALNHFTTRLVSPVPQASAKTKQLTNHGCLTLSDPTWFTSNMGQALVPWGLRRILKWVAERYGKTTPVIITASGIDDQAVQEDTVRQHYVKSYLQEALKAKHTDGVNLQGFYMWKLQDGPTPQFGFFTSDHQQSKPKQSVAVYRDIIAQGGFPTDIKLQYMPKKKQGEY
ncbi:beta-klotho [Synchiropus picturatus]